MKSFLFNNDGSKQKMRENKINSFEKKIILLWLVYSFQSIKHICSGSENKRKITFRFWHCCCYFCAVWVTESFNFIEHFLYIGVNHR